MVFLQITFQNNEIWNHNYEQKRKTLKIHLRKFNYMTLKGEIYRECKNAIEKTIDYISKNPYIFITEADLRSHLYLELLKKKIFKKQYFDGDIKLNLLHAEYYYKIKGEEYGFHDIVILDPNRINEIERIDRKPILYGFELKLKENYELDETFDEMEYDSTAFRGDEKEGCAKYGFVIFINQNQCSMNVDLKRFKKRLQELKRKKQNKNVFFYYVEILYDEEYYNEISVIK